MSKTNLSFGLLGVVIGVILGSIVGSFTLKPHLAEATPPPATQQQNVTSNQLPEGHPPLDQSGLQIQLAQAQAVLEKDPQNLQALMNSGNIYFDMKNFQAAVRYYELALAQNNKDVNLITDLGTSYFYSNNPDKAIEMYKRSLSIDPTHQQTLMNMGVVRMALGDKKGAADAWEKLVQAHPDSPEAANLRDMVQKLRAES